jgi:hypothetical protein
MDTAEWLFHQLIPPAGQTSGADSPAYHPVASAGENDQVMQVFRIDPSTSNQALVALCTAIRTIADVQRVFPYEAGKALAIRGDAGRVAAAEWMIHELGKATDASQLAAAHEFQMASYIDGGTAGVVRVFYLSHHESSAELSSLITQVRTTAQIQRVLPIPDRHAIVLRGLPDQIPAIEALIAKFDAGDQ